MSVAAYLPPRPAPPHDPLSMVLSAGEGWRDAGASSLVQVSQGTGALALAELSPPGPTLTDPSGILGGLLPPPWVALAPDGALYLLDRAGRCLFWFDPCTCRFLALPCLAPDAPSDPRAMAAPVAIAAGHSALLMADGRDGGAVVLMSRRDLSIRLVLRRDWLPGPAAIGGDGRFYIADLKAGAVHRFTPDGRLLGTITGAGLIYGLGLDRVDRLYVVSTDTVRRFAPDGTKIDEPANLAALRRDFAKVPVITDAAGHLVLDCGRFDAAGAPFAGAPAPWPAAVFATEGRLIAGPLDNQLAACVWHRILLNVAMPAHTRLRVRARSDEIALPVDLITPPDDPAWSVPQTWAGPIEGGIECLFTCRPGRFLWLEISLAGTGSETPRIASARIEFPRIPLRRYLPAGFVQDPVGAEFTDRFLAIFDQGFRSVERQIDSVATLFDPRATPAKMLAWLASWVGLSFSGGLGLAERRRLLREVPRLYARRGTLEGLREMLILFLGLDRAACPPRSRCPYGPTCPPPQRPFELPKMVLEHWRLRRWLVLGHGRLGEASRLWGERILNRSRLDDNAQLGVTQIKLERDPIRDPFHAEAHIFSVFLPAGRARQAASRLRIEALIRREAPAHTEPVVHWVEPNMRLGLQSTLGFDSVIGARPPAPITLDAARLGRATVLKPKGPPTPGVPLVPATRLGLGTKFG